MKVVRDCASRCSDFYVHDHWHGDLNSTRVLAVQAAMYCGIEKESKGIPDEELVLLFAAFKYSISALRAQGCCKTIIDTKMGAIK